MQRMVEGADAVSRLMLFVDDTPGLTLLDIRAKARRVQQRQGLDLVVLDYLQLAKGDTRAATRHHQIEAISRGLKELAKELGIAVVLLSQVSRQATSRADGEPTLADLKESGAIEEDGDTVLILHPRDVVLADRSMLIAAIVAKNRHGRRGRIALAFEGAIQRWREVDADVSPATATTTTTTRRGQP